MKDAPIATLKLKPRLSAALRRIGAVRVSDLDGLGYKTLTRFNGVGKVAALDLKEKLSRKGIEMPEEGLAASQVKALERRRNGGK